MLMNQRLVALCLSGVTVSLAWGPKFERLRGGGYGNAARTMLRNRKEASEDPLEPTIESSLFQSNPIAFHLFQPDGVIEVDELSQSNLLVVSSDAIIWDPSTFGGSNPFEEDELCADDEHEEECPIPEELKVLNTDEDSIDVLDYLGIKRAKPLQVEKYAELRDWD